MSFMTNHELRTKSRLHAKQIGIPIWRKMTDSKIKAHRQEHEQKLKAEGFFDQ
jgi:hypothetical protein